MVSKEKQGIIAVTLGGIFLLFGMIGSAVFAQEIIYGEYLFSIISLSGLILLFIGMRKIMQHTISTRR